VAEKIGLPLEQVFKTLLTTGGHGDYVFAVIPGDAELDFKKLARAAGLRKAEMAPLKDVQPLTGYIRGGVTALACKKNYPVFADETMAGLSPSEIEEILVVLSRLNEQGITIVLIEHIMRAVMSFSTRLVVLVAGQKIADGAPQEAIRNPEVERAYLGE